MGIYWARVPAHPAPVERVRTKRTKVQIATNYQILIRDMADACKLTAGAGGGKGLEQAMGQTIKGKCESEYQEKKHCIFYSYLLAGKCRTAYCINYKRKVRAWKGSQIGNNKS